MQAKRRAVEMAAVDVEAEAPESDEQIPVQIRGGMVTSIILRIRDPKSQKVYTMLADRIAQAPNFFRHAPVVLDLQDLADAPPFNIAELGRRLRQHSLVPIGVQNGTEEQNLAAVNAGFSLVGTGAAGSAIPREDRRAPASTDAETVETDTPSRASTKVITRPVRSGQQAYARGGDLIVLALTSSGAELIADGNIHVYGALRGRAIAGACGDAGARIFCRSLEADLVSIAGNWQVRDDMPDGLIGKPAQISLRDEKLIIEPLP
jgi:septum site-determining protein MinC